MGRVYYDDDDPLKTQESLARYVFAQTYVEGNIVLDVGCGARRGPVILAQSAREVVGSDVSAEAIAYCVQYWPSPKVRYVVSDALSLSFSDAAFDVVSSFEVIEHLVEQEQFLREIRRVLKKDGVCLMSTPNRLVMSPDGVFTNPDHVKELSADEFKTLLLTVFSHVELYGQRSSSRVREVLRARQGSYQDTRCVPIFLRHFFPPRLRGFLFNRYISFFSRVHRLSRQEDIHESDFPITKDAVEQARYLVAVCHP